MHAAIDFTDSEVVLSVDYQGFDEEDQENITETASFTIENTGDTAREVSFSIDDLPSGYALTSAPSVTIEATSTATAEVTLTVPHKRDSGRSNLATLRLTSSEGTTTVPLIQETTPMLIITDLNFDYVDDDNDNQDDNFDTEDENSFELDRNVLPGTEMVIEIKIKNLFDDKDYDDSEIENIELTIEADDNDILPDDFEEDYEFSDLEAKEDAELLVRFDINDEAESGDYELEFTLIGEDSAGVEYEVVKTVTFEVERQRDDVRLSRATTQPTTITSCDASFLVDIEIKNYGTQDQDHVGLSIYNQELDIDINIENIELQEFDDDDNNYQQRFTIALDNPAVKSYSLDARVYIDRDEQIDQELIKVPINRCPGTQQPEEQEEDNTTTGTTVITTTVPNTTQQNTTTTSNGILQTVEDPNEREERMIFIALIVAIALVVIMIGLFMAILLKK